MTDKEKKALEIIEPFMDKVIRFHRSRTLLGSQELRTKLAEAFYILTEDELTTKKVRNGSCNNCATKALDVLYSLHKQSLSKRVSKPNTKGSDAKPKRGRGRPRKKQ